MALIVKDTLNNQIHNAGFEVAGLIVPPDVFDHIANELSELAARSEQGQVVTKLHPLWGMDIMCDRKGLFDWSTIFAVMLDKNNHPVRMIMRDETVGRIN